MFQNYLRLTFRTFFKNRAPFLINLAGMGIALGCCITAYVNWEYNSNFDRLQAYAENLYRVSFWQNTERGQVPYGVVPIPVGNLLRGSLHEGDEVIQYISKDAQFRIGDELFKKEFIYADPSFTKIFFIDRLYGTMDLTDKTQVLISDKLAITYFGTADVVGKPLTQVLSNEKREFTVAGVYKAFPFNSSFRFDLITMFDNYFIDPSQKSVIENDWSKWTTTFLYIKDNSYLDALTKQLQGYIKTQNEARPDLQAQSFYIEPFVGMSHRAIRQRNQGHWMNGPMPPAAVIAPIAMAGFLLLVACFNFMNNAIAVAGNRLKEIGIRKVIGGRRKELIIQFLSETFVFCLMALGLALFLAEYFTMGWNALWSGIELKVIYQDNIAFFIAIGLLMIFTALLAGGYPAFYISAFKPIQILRGTTKFGGTNLFTKSLLVVQFSISLAAVIFALAFYFNSKYQKEYDLGYSYGSVIQVPLDNPDQFEPLKSALASNGMFNSVAGTQQHIYASSYKASARSEKTEAKEIDVLNIGDDYFQTVDVRVIAGTGFEKKSVSDERESIIVNEYFLKAFNLEGDGLGQRIMLNDTTPVFIKAVVKDVYLRALFAPISPVAFRYIPEGTYKMLIASTRPETLLSANEEIKKEWKKLFPNQLYPGQFMEQRMVMVMEHFDGVVILYTFLGFVAIVMSVSGLYSLISLNLQKRTKELGIRKIMGAPLLHMIVQSSKLFIVIMIISCGVGSLLGSVMVNAMMDNIWEYYVAINFKVLSMASLILFAIAVTTIGVKVMKVSVRKPVESLRYE
jgi:ABC-type antimicrobial peptide transport system permease subunit